MACLSAATPAFIVTLTATIILAVVVLCVPYAKTVYFLKASVDHQSFSGNITFGTLGYCLERSGVTTCSQPSIGYKLDTKGNSLPVQIPQVFVRWVTTLLAIHIIALLAAAAAALLAFLAHIPGLSIPCFGTCISWFASFFTLTAFLFDFAIFNIIKSKVFAAGTAHLGNAIRLTLAAWALLFVGGLLRCCALS